jgi:protein-tyrosine-phosphatase
MAHAMLRSLAPNITVYSAGVAPGLQISANAELVVRAAGYSAEGLYPKHVRQYLNSSGNFANNHQAPNLVFTLCDNARKELPVLPADVSHFHHGFTDPYHATGNRAERVAVYEHVRAGIEEWLRSEVLPMLQTGAAC